MTQLLHWAAFPVQLSLKGTVALDSDAVDADAEGQLLTTVQRLEELSHMLTELENKV